MKRNLLLLCAALISSAILAESMPTGYYSSIEGKSNSALKDALRSVIRPHTVIPYGSGSNSTWEVFFYSDRDPQTGEIMDMYCDDWKVVTTPGQVAGGCNIEHSFAKSWWGGAEYDQYKDCHHLNPSNGTANSSRSNYPLGVPTQDLKTSGTGSLRVGKAVHTVVRPDGTSLTETHYVFEPKDEYKGDFARAYFYIATCYGHDTEGNCPDLKANNKKNYPGWRTDNKDVGSYYAMRNDSYLEFQDWEIEVLLAWHRMDPVSKKELDRMEAVADFQHNRNPYIDYPCLAEYIWGNRKGVNVSLSDIARTYETDWLSLTDSTQLSGCNCDVPPAPEPEPEPQSVSQQQYVPAAHKLMREGRVFIIRDEKIYDLMGNLVR